MGAFVAERAKGSASVAVGNAKTFTISVSGITPGNMVAVALAPAGNLYANPQIADDKGNSYALMTSQGGAAVSILPHSSFPTVSPTTLTVTIDNTGASALVIAYKVLEFSGVLNTVQFSVQGYQASGTNVTVGSLTPGDPNDFCIGFVSSSVAQIAPSGITTGFFFAGSTRNAAPDICAYYKFAAGNPTGTVTVAWNTSCASAFAAASFAAPPVTNRTISDTGLTVSDSIVRTTTARPFGFVAERAKGGSTTTVATGANKTFAITVSGGTVGNSLYLALFVTSKLVTLVSVTDNVGNTYHVDQSLVGSGSRSMWIVSGYMAVAPTTLTITTTSTAAGAVGASYKVEEFSGGRNPPAFDNGYIAEDTGGSSFPPGAVVGGATAELYIWAGGFDTNPGAYTPSGSMTQAGTTRAANPDIAAAYSLSTLNASASSVGQVATGAPGISSQSMYLKALPAQQRTALDTGLSVSETLTRTVRKATTAADSGLVSFSDTLVRSVAKPILLTDTGLSVSDSVRKAPRPIDRVLTLTDSLARTVRVSFALADAGMAFFDAGISTSKPKAMTDTGLVMSQVLWRLAARPVQDTGLVVASDTILASTHALGMYSISIAGFGMTPGATDTLRLSKGIVRLFDTGVTVSDLFRHVAVTQPVRGSRRWMAGRAGGSDLTG